MKKVIAIFAICLMVIPMLSATVATEEVTRPYEWIEYSEYELNGKDTARLILIVICEDMSLDYKGWYPEFDEEWQRERILDDIYTAVEIIDGEPTEGWQIQLRNIIVKIQGDIDNWVLNNAEGKDYTEWLEYAVYFLDNPDELFKSEIVPFWCHGGGCWSWCYQK